MTAIVTEQHGNVCTPRLPIMGAILLRLEGIAVRHTWSSWAGLGYTMQIGLLGYKITQEAAKLRRTKVAGSVYQQRKCSSVTYAV